MKNLLFILVAACAAAAAHTQARAQGQPAPVAELSKCLAENTTGKDRKDLAKWVFFAMSSHPDMKPFVSASASTAIEESNRTMAGTFTRLLAEVCQAQTRAAFNQGGAVAIQSAFETLGRLAMQELMSNPEVAANMGSFERHLDRAKMNKALGAGQP